jgi:hypothetical protein
MKRSALRVWVVSGLASLAVLGSATDAGALGSRGFVGGHAITQNPAWTSALSASQASSLSSHATDRVIVLLRNEQSNLAGPSRLSARASALATDQTPIVDQLHQLHASRVVGYRMVNAVATTVSPAEATNLAEDPAVLAVVPDSIVQGPSSDANLLAGASAASAGNGGSTSSSTSSWPGGGSSGLVVSGNQTCPGPGQPPLIAPEALSLIHAYSQDPSVPSAQGLGYDGSGVKIAVFPDGVDPNNPDFQRSNGHGGSESAVTDYQDFTGEGLNAPTSGGEGFGDVSTLVAQAKTVFNLQQEINPAFSNPSDSCDIRVRGVAPGADVDVMKVFGDNNIAFDSIVLQALQYAVYHDHVNILSESFGEDDIPNPGTDPISLFDEQAIADGVSVIASTGDASPSNTEGNPALAPDVIGAAASTSYQAIAQSNGFLYDIGQVVADGHGPATYTLGQPTPGWLDNEVSTLSSSGITEDLRMPDIIAPGDSNWSDCSTNTAMYSDCANEFGGSNIGLEEFGGTSESAPLTSGTAALVIQAYREAHGGQTPSPAVIKSIILSSASDIDVPGDEMGAGLLNSLKAVELAKAWGSTSPSGGLTHSPDAISELGSPGSTRTASVQVTNSSSKPETATPQLRELGTANVLAGGFMPLSTGTSCDGVNSLLYQSGETIDMLNCTTVQVPSGVDQLDARIGWNPNAACATCTAGPPTVREILIDPDGRYANYSDPQGDGAGFADEQVHNPTPGRWTLVIFARTTSAYTGPVNYAVTGASYHDIPGVFSPASQSVAPGASASFTARIPLPSAPGDQTGSIQFSDPGSSSGVGTIPVALRAEVPVSAGNPGTFTGTLIGGNGRPNTFGNELTYQFTVPAGVHDIAVNLTVPDDGYLLLGQLDNPNNKPVDTEFSYTNTTPGGPPSNTSTTTLTWYDPTPGTWSLHVANVLTESNGVASGLTSVPLTGRISFDGVHAGISGLPPGALRPGSTVTAQVNVTNTGVEPENYFIDARRSTTSKYQAQSATVTSGTLPITYADTFPQYLVPPFSSQLYLEASTTGPRPIDFAVSPAWGQPEYESSNSTASSPAAVTIPDPIASAWGFGPTEIGPFGNGTATTEPYDTSGTVSTLTFDPDVTASTGDLWAETVGEPGNFSPLFLDPGQSGTISVTFTIPRGSTPPGTGDLYLETINPNLFPDGSSDVLTAFPYSIGNR